MNSEIENTVVTKKVTPFSTVTHRGCALQFGNNPSTSLRHPSWVKMYAELGRIEDQEGMDKKPTDNKLYYAQLGSGAPGWNNRISLNSP